MEVETTAATPVAVLPDETVVALTAEAVELPSPMQLNPIAQHVASWSLLTVQYDPLAHRAPEVLQQMKFVGS